jgi:hypothetical protein
MLAGKVRKAATRTGHGDLSMIPTAAITAMDAT